MWPQFKFPFTVHFILIKPVLSDHLPYVTIFHHCLAKVWLYIENPEKLSTGSVKFFTYLSATIPYALSTNCNRLVEETFPAPKSQKNKWETDFVNINFTWRIPSPKHLTRWPWKSIGFQILLRTKYVPSLVKIHWRMLILECSQRCYGRTVALLYPFATSLARG